MSQFGDGTFEHPERSLRDLGAAFEWSEKKIAALTAERDAAISLGRHALFCTHHTDAERIANTVGGNCPICNKAQIRQLAELAKAKAAEITRLAGIIEAKQSQLKEANSWLDECMKQWDALIVAHNDALLRLHVTTAERDAARADVAQLRAAFEGIVEYGKLCSDGDATDCERLIYLAKKALNTPAQ